MNVFEMNGYAVLPKENLASLAIVFYRGFAGSIVIVVIGESMFQR